MTARRLVIGSREDSARLRPDAQKAEIATRHQFGACLIGEDGRRVHADADDEARGDRQSAAVADASVERIRVPRAALFAWLASRSYERSECLAKVGGEGGSL